MRKYVVAMILWMLPLFASAASDNPADQYFSKQNPVLTPQEKAAIAIARKWQDENAKGVRPVAGPEGSVLFMYGAQQINVVCAVLQICDIELQAGEQVNNLHVGDPRFTVEPAVTGVGPAEIQHLIIKPLDVGLKTSLIVTTNRRTYHINLRSHRTEFMPRVAFTYTEDALAKWDGLRSREAKEKQENTIPGTGEYLGNLNFDYEITGSAAWKPIRVYNDGAKTIIEMPPAMAKTEAPTLLVVRKEGGFFKEDETVMVNYRVQGNRYIVDTVFEKAILITGVGTGQDRVTITKAARRR
ncbi:P-type conjugative transfer protein TrbG [Geomonas azotofigens]|uniref:P-type conjugative transfer protein TrbG n=1 Tax=Geomonas azotofigens TaxID=2843196 RepID=UPI001C0F9EEB|nr:P-type conjugative transfer protein TrbG [Geomonas azotofigens]MBU5612653.1 P-type conjugative transfer protein TrbG [Geomonas azotofigens]